MQQSFTGVVIASAPPTRAEAATSWGEVHNEGLEPRPSATPRAVLRPLTTVVGDASITFAINGLTLSEARRIV
ncbi:hypothetical protein EVAR_26869_1 [Eumeta japonica]|uniref:Uncharacterized protein n=1 Tax=Eumeta variegata TaxID=151549 RepID=A0A4C1VXX3_EUMVA|nr:hypothetical protein EVAR_26869_1 [Eumeta japonica]